MTRLFLTLFILMSAANIFADDVEGSYTEEEQYAEVVEGPCSCPCGCCKKRTEQQAIRWDRAAHCFWQSPYPVLDGDAATCFGHCGLWGVWLPEEGPLFKPLMASPRQLTYSVGWRFNDQALAKNVIPVSFADNIAFIRWCNVWPWGGVLQLNLDGGLWAVFDPISESTPLLNADYYVGLPIEYAIGRWTFRLRAYHISSHVGDEFLIDQLDEKRRLNFDRKNPSAEYLDLYVSNMFTDEIRLYGGVGWVVQHDESFNTGKFYTEAGVEIKLYRYGFYDPCQNLYGTPFFAMDFLYFDTFSKHIDSTYVMGYEWGKTCGCFRKMRIFMEYHDGYNIDGQFCKTASNYFSIRLSYGY